MDIQSNRLSEVIVFYNANGSDRTVQTFGISHETLGRYKREYKIRFGGLDGVAEEFASPKILVIDIETLPIKSYHWGLWKQNISPSQIIADWCMATWSAKWLNDNEIFGGQITPKEALARDDKRISKEIWAFLEEADVVIAHNGDSFDIPRLNTRFILNGINPPMTYQSIDTLKLVRKKFSFSSNKLDYIGTILGLGNKIKTDFDLWRGVDQGDQASIDKMAEYNKRDVTLLEEVYLKVGHWMPSHPNLGIYVNDNQSLCPHCTSADLHWKGFYTTLVSQYSTFRCGHCGFIGRSRVGALSKEKRQSLVTSGAR